MPSLLRFGCLVFLARALAVGAAAANVRITTDVVFLAPDRAEKLDLYEPASRPANFRAPAVVWIHGGGWTGGTKSEARAKEICTTFASAGYVAVSIDYKLGEGAWPANLHDCKNAVRFLRAHAEEYGVDPRRIAVAGGSAGGHLALMVAFTADQNEREPADAQTPYPGVSSAVRCVIDLYGVADLVTSGETDAGGAPTATRVLMAKSLKVFGAANDGDAVLRLASPVQHVTKSSPPTLVLHGDADAIVDHAQSEKLVRVLRERAATHEFILLSGVGHSFDFESWQQKPLPRDLRPVALAFLEKHLGLSK